MVLPTNSHCDSLRHRRLNVLKNKHVYPYYYYALKKIKRSNDHGCLTEQIFHFLRITKAAYVNSKSEWMGAGVRDRVPLPCSLSVRVVTWFFDRIFLVFFPFLVQGKTMWRVLPTSSALQVEVMGHFRTKHLMVGTWPSKGLPLWLSGRDLLANAADAGSIPWVGKSPWRRKCQPTPVFLVGESHGQRSLGGYSPWGHKESDTTEQLHNTTTHQSLFLPGTAASGLQRDWAACQHRHK